MLHLSDFLSVWTSILLGSSLLVNLVALSQYIYTHLLNSYLLCLLLQLAQLLFAKVPLMLWLWTGATGLLPCQGTCIADFALSTALVAFLALVLLFEALLNRLTQNTICLALGLGLLTGICVGLQACLRGGGICFGYIREESQRKSLDWVISLGTNGMCLLTLLSSGLAVMCRDKFTSYVLTRLLPDTPLLFFPLGLFLLLLRYQRDLSSESSAEDELQHLIDTSCPFVLSERLAQSQTTMV
ncbi:Uncharacterized protein FKW44_009032 [Caligus rogercresseyi]|uniref:Uncharacterized protein n=1 Tax=Caligus rogercresseyi TaxID=217165 RepID=A0A7T8K8L0_CALRO|nr:Uncharacterized protein FKW44_009032 [Caligus rogercresseyi]